jgi:hypothetical protein
LQMLCFIRLLWLHNGKFCLQSKGKERQYLVDQGGTSWHVVGRWSTFEYKMAMQVFTHNDVVHLEAVLRTSIAEGQPRTHRPWKKIMIVVEGIYSMEGQMCRLAEIVEIKNRYKVSFKGGVVRLRVSIYVQIVECAA